MTLYEGLTLTLQTIVGIAAFITLLFLHRQLRVMQGQLAASQETTRAQSSLSLATFLQAPEVRQARHIVRSVLSNKPFSEWTPEDKHAAAMVCANYDVVASLLRARMAPADLVINNWGPSIRHCHSILCPYISECRASPGGHETYWSNFDWLCATAASPQA